MKKRLLIVFGALLLLGLAGSLWALQGTDGGAVEILLDGEVLYRLESADLAQDRSLPIQTPFGYNIISIEDGKIRVSEADCPDQTCVRMGELRSAALPIVCLPHRLVIQFAGESGQSEMQLDASTR